MQIKPSIGTYTVYASDYCKLDSHVIHGGGTDETVILQSILDMAPLWGSLHLIMDGAALVTGLAIHSNTTVECLSASCGFFMADGSNDAILRNYHYTLDTIQDENIVIRGGTYNHNGQRQAMELTEEKKRGTGHLFGTGVVVPLNFFGVRNFRIENIIIHNQRRYALFMANWEDVIISGVDMPLWELVDHTNQDGLHFYGPGKNLTIRDCRGRSGDDFIAINTDEGDRHSSISNVLIENLQIDAYQGVRLLCRERGTLENVIIRNITGKVSAYGFYINPWYWDTYISPDFDGTSGTFKNILIENVILKQENSPYDYNTPLLFCLGGEIENIAIRNVSVEPEAPDYRVLAVREGHGYLSHVQGYGISPTRVDDLLVDGLYITDGGKGNSEKHWIEVEGDTIVKRMKLSNVTALSTTESESLIHVDTGAKIEDFSGNAIQMEGFQKLMK